MKENLFNRLACGRVAIILLFCIPLLLVAAEVEREQDPDNGLLSWRLQDQGLSIELIQLHPDYVRAIYGSRGFPADIVEDMASYCVFGTIIKNLSNTTLAYRVAEWKYVSADAKEHEIKTKTQWLKEWRARNIKFAWSLLPDDQVFAVGDWSQGFTTIKLPPGSAFDLKLKWKLEEKIHVQSIKNLLCVAEEKRSD